MACHFFLPVLELFLLCINKGAFAPFGWVAPPFFSRLSFAFFSRSSVARYSIARSAIAPPGGFFGICAQAWFTFCVCRADASRAPDRRGNAAESPPLPPGRARRPAGRNRSRGRALPKPEMGGEGGSPSESGGGGGRGATGVSCAVAAYICAQKKPAVKSRFTSTLDCRSFLCKKVIKGGKSPHFAHFAHLFPHFFIVLLTLLYKIKI